MPPSSALDRTEDQTEDGLRQVGVGLAVADPCCCRYFKIEMLAVQAQMWLSDTDTSQTGGQTERHRGRNEDTGVGGWMKGCN
jgi:hypothetical protein